LAALSVLWAPVRTLREAAEGRRVLLAFLVTATYAALGLVSGAIGLLGGLTQAQLEAQGQQLPPGSEELLAGLGVATLVVAVVSPFVTWFLVSGVMHLVSSFFGGTGPFSGTLAAVGVAQVPLVIAAALAIPLTGLQIVLDPESPVAFVPGTLSSLLGIAALLWFVVLVVIGAALARGIGYGESAGSCAISCAGCLGLIILVGIAVGVVLVLASRTAGAGAL
jgi:hypothetical protein